MAPRIRLGELLVRAGVLDEYKLKAALAEQQRWGGRIGKILVDMNFVSEEILVKALSKQLAVPLANLDAAKVPPQLLERLDTEFARANLLCPEQLYPDRRTLVVAMADPINVKVIDEITYRTGYRVEPTLSGERAILVAIARLYGADTAAIDSTGGEEIFIDNSGGVREMSRPPSVADVPRPVALVPPQPAPAPALAVPTAAQDPVVGMVEALDEAHKKQLRAIRAMVDLLVDKGLLSREEYLARLNRH